MPASKAQRAVTAERRAKAIAMKLAGADWETIAERLGYASRGAAFTDVDRALAQRAAELRQADDTMREVALMRLDRYQVKAEEVLRRKHITVNNGKVIYVDGAPLVDDEPTLRAIKTLLDIEQRRAKLLGLDAPSESKVDVTVTEVTQADLEFREMVNEERARRAAARNSTVSNVERVAGE